MNMRTEKPRVVFLFHANEKLIISYPEQLNKLYGERRTYGKSNRTVTKTDFVVSQKMIK